ncbi:hypothetical protein QBC46DRAFT_420623 [Diplogelasinospora grovesii]|uniref:non-specific serine/threonine protein kinase n=1 Tax=Diplogelasinospora grovesii TaxID=303347 RepID=A0AAN6S0Y3_9PEZI|nr:hypothetical protein QBC46DRAFT_420623 [Diplogelasinospora grovesii]
MDLEINSFSDLACLSQDTVKSGPGDEKIPRTSFVVLDADDNAYFGIKLGTTIGDITLDQIRGSLQPLPEGEIYALFPREGEGGGEGGLTVAPDDLRCIGHHYIKRPAWHNYVDFMGGDDLAQFILQEARTMEVLSQHPHPNIIRYHGCRVKRGRIIGLVVEGFEFEKDLLVAEDYPEFFRGKLDKAFIMSGLRSALDHLHSLGWAHNDLNPANIMLKPDYEEGGIQHYKPVLIDFGSCQPFGKMLLSAGTQGWCKEEMPRSDKRNDDFGLALLGPWLDNVIGELEKRDGAPPSKAQPPSRYGDVTSPEAEQRHDLVPAPPKTPGDEAVREAEECDDSHPPDSPITEEDGMPLVEGGNTAPLPSAAATARDALSSATEESGGIALWSWTAPRVGIREHGIREVEERKGTIAPPCVLPNADAVL